MDELLKVGEITKPQGVLGEVKVRPYVDDAECFLDFKELFIGDKIYKKAKARVVGDDVFLCFYGVSDRNTAELLRGKELFVYREELEDLYEDEGFFIVDVLGANVVLSDGTNIGTVIDVTQANVDVFTVQKANGKILRFPFLKDLLINMDIKGKKVLLDAKRFLEVVCYED